MFCESVQRLKARSRRFVGVAELPCIQSADELGVAFRFQIREHVAKILKLVHSHGHEGVLATSLKFELEAEVVWLANAF